jgi:hypothetical protein
LWHKLSNSGSASRPRGTNSAILSPLGNQGLLLVDRRGARNIQSRIPAKSFALNLEASLSRPGARSQFRLSIGCAINIFPG